MAKEYYDQEIDKHTDWGGDESTGGIPVKGNRVQEFIKNTLNKKMGYFYYDEGNNRYIVFADEDSKNEYLEDPQKTELILGTFDAPFNYTAEINLTSPNYVAILSGQTNNYIDFTFDVKNKQGASTGEDVIVTFTITRGANKQTISQKYRYGASVHFNIDKYLGTGLNTISITVTGSTSLASTTTAVTYQVVDLQLTDELDISKVYGGSSTVEVPYSLSGYGTKIMEWYLDGELLPFVKDEDEVVEVSTTRTKYIQLSGLSEGKHNIQFRAYTIANDEKFYSYTLYRDIIVSRGETNNVILATATTIPSGEPIIQGGALTLKGITQYVSYELQIAAYNPTGAATNVEIYLDSAKQGEVTVSNRNTVTYNLVVNDYGSKTLKLKAGITEYDIPVDIEKSDTNLTEITSGLFLDLQAVGKNNSSINKDVWEYGEYSTTFNGFKWNENSGWNNNRLVITQGAYIDINVAPLATKATETGLTLEFEFSTRDVADNDEVICDLTNSNGTGLLITASEVTLKSAGGAEVTTKFKSEENIRIALVINKNSGVTNKMLAFIYIDGILSGSVNYASTDNFIANKEVRFASSEDAGIELKAMRFYNVALSSDQILNNYMLYRDTIEEMLEAYDKNNVYEEGTTDFSPDILAGQLPVMIVTGDIPRLENTTDKNLEIVVDVEYTNLQDPTRSFSVKNAIMRPQGTSSMSYPKKNFRLYTQRRDDTILYDADGKEVENKLYAFKEGAQPVNCWCMKADYAESSGTHNTGVARLWNDVMKNAIIDGEFKCRTNAQTKAAENKYPYDVRTTVDGFPILMFYRLTADDNLIFIGKYNFNNDKSTESVFGFEDIPGFDNTHMQCWEVLNNGHHLALFQDVNNFDSEWQDAFEARYPDVGEDADVTALKAFATWLVSTKDNPEKFRLEKADHIDLYKMAAYYIYFMRFGAVDQTVKNAMFTSEDGQHFYYINYDNDTILGVRNDGLLIYDPTIDRQSVDESFSTTVYAYAGHDSTLWNNLEADEEFMELVRTVDDALYSAGLSYAKVIEMFDDKQSKMWPERIYNQDAQYKYIGPYVNSGVNNLYMLQGARRAHRRWWLSRRFNYIDSLFVSGEYKANIFEIKVAGAPIGIQFSIKSGYDIGYGYGVNNIPIETGIVLKPGESHTFTTKQVLNIGDPLRIYSAVNLQEIDVHGFIEYLSTVNMDKVYSEALGTRLKKLVLGVDVSSDTKRNTSLSEISGLSSAKALEYLDIAGYKGIKSLDLTPFNNFKTLKAKQSGLTSVQFADGSLVELVELPDTLQSLIMSNLEIAKENVVLENKYNLRYISIKGCRNFSTDFSYIYDWFTHKTSSNIECTLIMTDVSWTGVTASQLINLHRLEEDGGTLQLTGKVVLTSVTLTEINLLIAAYGENCFSPNSEFYISAPGAVFLAGPSSVYEGDTAQYTAVVFSEHRGTVTFSVENGGDNISIDAESGLLTTTEIGQAKTITVKVTHTPTEGSAQTETLSVSIKKRVYPTMTIEGESEIAIGQNEFALKFTPQDYNGVFNVNWSISGEAVTSGLVEIQSQSKNTCMLNVLRQEESTFTIKATMTKNYDSSTSSVTKSVTITMSDSYIIMTKETNPEVLAVCYAQGWCASEEHMTYGEAKAVTSLNEAFRENTDITHFEELKFFEGIVNLGLYEGKGEFYGCSNLEVIVVPGTLKTIGSNCFVNCVSLRTFNFPKGFKHLYKNSKWDTYSKFPFHGCSNLESFTGERVIDGMYYYNIKDSSGSSERSLVAFAPKNHTHITINVDTLYSQYGIQCLGSYLFADTDIEYIKISGSGHYPYSDVWGGYLCANCKNLKTVDLSGFNPGTHQLYRYFEDCTSLTTGVILPPTIDKISDYMFRGCTSLNIDIPYSVTIIGNGAFQNCTSLEAIDIRSCTNIYDSSFAGCSKVKSITAPLVAPTLQGQPFGNFSSGYTGRDTYNTGENKLYVPQGATGYDTGEWANAVQNSNACGFTLVEMVG